MRSSPGGRGQPGATSCLIEVRGVRRHDKQLKPSLLTDYGFDSLSYQASFTVSETIGRPRLPRTAFCANFRGREVPGAPALDPARIRQVGLIFAARQAGTFALDIWRIGLGMTGQVVPRPAA